MKSVPQFFSRFKNLCFLVEISIQAVSQRSMLRNLSKRTTAPIAFLLHHGNNATSCSRCYYNCYSSNLFFMLYFLFLCFSPRCLRQNSLKHSVKIWSNPFMPSQQLFLNAKLYVFYHPRLINQCLSIRINCFLFVCFFFSFVYESLFFSLNVNIFYTLKVHQFDNQFLCANNRRSFVEHFENEPNVWRYFQIL